MELHRLSPSRIYRILSLTLLFSLSTSSRCVSNPSGLCHARDTFPEWCSCNSSSSSMPINLIEDGIVGKASGSALLYYFSNVEKAVIARCTGANRLCLCTQDEKSECRTCELSNSKDKMCLYVEDGTTVKVHQGTRSATSCTFRELCHTQCACDTDRSKMPTFAPPLRPNKGTTTTVSTVTKDGMTDEPQGVGVGFILAGVFVLIVVVVLFIILVFCWCKHKAIGSKRENPYETVYSTVGDGGSLPNGSANFQLYPNQFYDAQITRTPVLPPSRQDVPVHYKSMPSLHTMNVVTTDFKDPQYQPYLPHHQPIWKNHPTLHRYPSSDGITAMAYVTDGQSVPNGTYMKLKQSHFHPYQTLATTRSTAELTAEDIERFRELTSKGRPGYQKPQETPTGEKGTITEDYALLIRDPRSLPTEGTPKEYHDQRQHGTYGFERKSNSRTKQKPIPAKRGHYRSKGEVTSEGGDKNGPVCSSDSDNEEYQGVGSEGSHYYFKMNTARSDGSASVTLENEDRREPTEERPTKEIQKKKNSRRKPKPRSRRQRRRPTTEVTCAMIENPLASSSHDEADSPSAGEYTDDDIEDGLNRLSHQRGDDPTVKHRVGGKPEFEDSDYHSPESYST